MSEFIAASPEYLDVSASVALANDGDTVFIPSGSATWSNTLHLYKAVSLIGAGVDDTVIFNVTHTVIRIHPLGSNFIRISGIKFDQTNHSTAQYVLLITGLTTQLRIDHCWWEIGDWSIAWNPFISGGTDASGFVAGVIDHCTFHNCTRAIAPGDVRSADHGLNLDGYTAWTEPIVPGSINYMYLEDNTFLYDSGISVYVDPDSTIYGNPVGGSAVIRHNLFTGYNVHYIDAHGDVSEQYSTKYYEIYNNDFIYGNNGPNGSFYTGDQRGGSWIVWGNYISQGHQYGWLLWNYCANYGHTVKDTYFWGNTMTQPYVAEVGAIPGPIGACGPTTAPVQNIDWFLHAPELGQTFYPYTPLVYPHPLVSDVISGEINFVSTSESITELSSSITIYASRTGGTSGSISVNYSSSAITAVPNVNYTSVSGTLSWGDSDSSNKSFNVPVINQSMIGNKTFLLSLSNASGGATIGSFDSDIITIVGSAETSSNHGLMQESSNAVSITSPFTLGVSGSITYLYSPTNTTVPESLGIASYTVDINVPGYYIVESNVSTTDGGSNSVYIDIDNTAFSDPYNVWDMPVTSGEWTQSKASWRGTGESQAQFSPKSWYINSGSHTLYIGSREANTKISNFTMSLLPPVNLSFAQISSTGIQFPVIIKPAGNSNNVVIYIV